MSVDDGLRPVAIGRWCDLWFLRRHVNHVAHVLSSPFDSERAPLPHITGMTARPRVPVRVEPFVTLRARYAEAVAEMISQSEVWNGACTPPSADARHVFDTPDGWRLIVSCERTPDGRVGVHFSASVHDRTRVVEATQLNDVLNDVVRSWQRIADSGRTPVYLGLSDAGIPHFFVEQGS